MIPARALPSRYPLEIGAIAGDRRGVIVSARLIALFMTRARSIRIARGFRNSKGRGKRSPEALGQCTNLMLLPGSKALLLAAGTAIAA
jgi:hypothetical protein